MAVPAGTATAGVCRIETFWNRGTARINWNINRRAQRMQALEATFRVLRSTPSNSRITQLAINLLPPIPKTLTLL